ncbi:hypothetical protein HDV03_001636 [Kappamyces sp. JEL0829]|nr:hypothetical protein HDV03_001636 [Kappamyces sp. JEL0829]
MLGFGNEDPVGIPTKTDAAKYKKAHDLLGGSRMNQTLKLKSGEQMSYAEVGDRNGIPAVWFGGPASNRMVIALYSDVCTELGVRLLAFDRPGRGASTPLRQPKEWTFATWAAYVDEATDALEISEFRAVAHSFGCSYLLASYAALSHKIVGPLRFLAAWAPSNLPCMPTSYALQRSLPTKFLRAWKGMSQNATVASLNYQVVPTQMGTIGNREKEVCNDPFAREILERMGADHLGDGFPSFELDWLLALEVQKPLGYNHKSIKASIKCWHGMDDSITPLGAAMWMQREMDHFLLYAVEGGTHNIHLDFAITKALFADICAEVMASKTAEMAKKATEEPTQAAPAVPETVASSETAIEGAAVETKPVDAPASAENVWA